MKITLRKAIEILDLNIREANPKMPPDCEASVWCGIEALQRELKRREYLTAPFYVLLPHEEPED